jgi:hypothetical protein
VSVKVILDWPSQAGNSWATFKLVEVASDEETKPNYGKAIRK